MTDKQIKQRLKMLRDHLTIAVWFEKEFKEKLGEDGYQRFIDRTLNEMNELTATINKKNLPPFKSD